MSRDYVLSEHAELDWEDLLDRVRADNGIDVAVRIDKELETALDRLVQFPRMGHTHDDLPRTHLVWSFYSYLIIYEPDTSPLRIHRISQGSQERPVSLTRRS